MASCLFLLLVMFYNPNDFTVEPETFIDQINLRSNFLNQVVEWQRDPLYDKWAEQEVIRRLKEISINGQLPISQYAIFADRNPVKQSVMVGYYHQPTESFFIIGWDKCATGKPSGGADYFLTPCGVFANTPENFGYRAAGTKNKHGWRGLGKKNSRVWDFGWQKTIKPRKERDQPAEIRLLMHATDPDFGEPNLGKPGSKGCVRISAKLNKFLDHYGIIDAVYQESASRPAIAALLPKDRQPVSEAGKYLIVADSTEWCKSQTNVK